MEGVDEVVAATLAAALCGARDHGPRRLRRRVRSGFGRAQGQEGTAQRGLAVGRGASNAKALGTARQQRAAWFRKGQAALRSRTCLTDLAWSGPEVGTRKMPGHSRTMLCVDDLPQRERPIRRLDWTAGSVASNLAFGAPHRQA